jgi:hypothetical protein
MARLHSFGDIKDFRGDLKRSPSDYTSYPELALLADGIKARFETYCNRLFERAVDDTQQYYQHSRMMGLSRMPVESVASVVANNAGDARTLDTAEYTVRDYGILLDSEIEAGAVLTVTYTGGYTVDGNDVVQVPHDLRNAALWQLSYEYEQRLSPGKQSLDTPVGKTTTPEVSLLNTVRVVLNHYMHPITRSGVVIL